MYGWLWRRLPGPTWVRVLTVLVLLSAVVVALFGWGFPALAPHLPFDDGLVGAAGAPTEIPAGGLSPRS